MPPVWRAEHHALFADGKQAGVFDLDDGVEVIKIFVAHTVTDIGPIGTTISGFQQSTISTHYITVIAIFKPDIKERSPFFTL